jgi:hypothetical protein
MNASDLGLDVRYSQERQELQKWRCVLVKVANAGFGAMTLLKREGKETSAPNNSVINSIQFSSVQFIGCSIRFSSV